MKRQILTFVSGFLFSIGLSIGGMTMPSKVIAFLDVAGNWDPSLMFVMVGAIGVYSLIFHLIKPKMEKPVYAEQFKLPTRLKIDFPLVVGAALFGAGWGLGGFCPGPALASSFLFDIRILVFIGLMALGIYLGSIIQLYIPRSFYRND